MKKKQQIFITLVLFVISIVFLSACQKEIDVTSIAVSGDETVEVGDNATYTAVISPADATNQSVVWSVVKEDGDATITDMGILTGVAPGLVKVVATIGEIEQSFDVTITLMVDTVSITGPDTVLMGSSGTYEYSVLPTNAPVDTYNWVVLAGTGNASITQDGVLTPIAPGSITIRATVNDVISTKVVTIKTPVTSISIQGPTEVRLEETPTYTYTVDPTIADIDSITWSVVNGTGSATIDQNGVLSPISEGMIDVKVIINDVTEIIEVELIVSVATVEVTGSLSFLPSETPVFTANVLPNNSTYGDVVWSVSDGTGSATINQDGMLTPVTSGTVVVIATADEISGELLVTIEVDDSMLGTPRPSHLLATIDNTIVIDSAWELESEIDGYDIVNERQVFDISFDAEASKSQYGVVFPIPSETDLSRMQYFAIKMTGETETTGVNPTVAVHLIDRTSGLTLYNDQVTEIELVQDNQWVVFQISNRYRLQTDNRDLAIVVDPHFTASGNAGMVTMQQVVFFGDADPVTEAQLLTVPKTAHWESNPEFTAEAAVDEIDGVLTDVIHATATAAAVSGWKALPAYVLEDISRKTHITFKVKLLTEGLPSNPNLFITLGDNDVQNVAILRPAEGVDPVYQTVTVAIPSALRTEANMWAARYVQIKANGGGGLDVEYFIYDFELTGDADPLPIIATRSVLGGPNVPFTSMGWAEGGVKSTVAAGEKPAHFLLSVNDNTELAKLEFTYSKKSSNLDARSGMNGIYVKIQGPAGIEMNLQQGWGDSWADESERKFILDGTVQEIYISALTRSIITSGTSGNIAFQFSASMPTSDMTDVEIKFFELSFTAILPIPEVIKDDSISFKGYQEGGNTIVSEVDTMTVDTDENENFVATVIEDNVNNHVIAIANDSDIRYMNQLTLQVKGAIGTQVTIKLAYGNMFNLDVDYVHVFTTDEMETIVIDIQDRDALKTSKLSINVFFGLNEVDAPVEFVIYDTYLSGIE